MDVVDTWLVEQFERFTHWTQRTFGIKAASWERFSLVVTGLCVALRLLPNDWRAGSRGATVLDGWILAVAVAAFFGVVNERTSGQYMNAEKLRNRHWRVIYSAVSAFDVVLVLGLMFSRLPRWDWSPWFECMTAAAIFRACDDLPPGESRVKSLLKSLRTPRMKTVETVS